MPLTMLTHHDAGDSSVDIVGRLTSISLAPDGSARYEAEIADTDHGRTIATLVDPSDGSQFLKGVSIRGAWVGPVKRKTLNGQTVEYADDLELDGLDFTKTPGVDGAGVESMTRSGASPRETVDGRVLIFESVQEAHMTIAETVDDIEAVVKQTHADPGYGADKVKRLPLDTRADALAAWRALGETTAYTPAQLKRVRERTQRALAGHGVTVTPERWIVTPPVPVAEAMEVWPDSPASYCVNVDNGMVHISVASWRVDPADLELVARKAMDGACAALAAMDPDMDGDIDADGTESAATDEDDTESGDATEAAPPAPVAETDAPQTPEPAAIPVAGQPQPQEEVPGMAEPTVTPAAGTPVAAPAPVAAAEVAAPAAPAPVEVTLTLSQVKDLFGSFAQAIAPTASAPQLVGAGAPVEAAPAAVAPVVETAAAAPAAAVQETTEQMVARLVQEGITRGVQEHVAQNGVQRKGLVENASAVAAPPVDGVPEDLPEGWPQKPLHKYTTAEQKQFLRPALEQTVMGARSVFRQP
jgi:hypothetical protein